MSKFTDAIEHTVERFDKYIEAADQLANKYVDAVEDFYDLLTRGDNK